LFLPISLFWLLGCYIKIILSRKKEFDIPIISIGNIEAGGTGKTPLTIEIAKIIKDVKTRISIICYTANRKYPDESILISRTIKQTTIYQGKNRRKLIDIAIENNPDIIIIDDGFQYFDIANKIDIILLDPETPLNLLIPSGRMRFPSWFLKYADAIVIKQTKKNMRFYKDFLKKIEAYHKPIFFAQYHIKEVIDLQNNKIPVAMLKNKNVIAFCGIAKPKSFIETISETGVYKIYAIWYPDHFVYHQSDINEIENLFKNTKADLILTTEKDMVKIREFNIDFPVYSLNIEMDVEPYDKFKSWIMNEIFPPSHFLKI